MITENCDSLFRAGYKLITVSYSQCEYEGEYEGGDEENYFFQSKD